MWLVCIAMARSLTHEVPRPMMVFERILVIAKKFGRSSKTSFHLKEHVTYSVNRVMIPSNVTNLKNRNNIKSLKHVFSASRETPLVSGSRTRTKTSRRGCYGMLWVLYDSPNTVQQQCCQNWLLPCLAINQLELVHEAATRATTQKSMYMPEFHVIASLGGLIMPYSWGVSDTLAHKLLPRNP